MDQQAQFHKRKRKLLFIVMALLSLVTIGVSLFIILNPRAEETATTEASGTVTITDRNVVPAIVTIKKGQNVTWINQDDAPHGIVMTSVGAPKELEGFGTTDALAKGEVYSFTFEASGTFTYNDPQNPENIKGTIIVE